SCRKTLAADDSLLIYSDGLSEASNAASEQYGVERLSQALRKHGSLAPDRLVAALMANWDGFRSTAPRPEDWTVMALRRAGGSIPVVRLDTNASWHSSVD